MICKKCGSDRRIPIKRKAYKTKKEYWTTKCRDCSNNYAKANRHQTRNWQEANRESLREYQRNYYQDKYNERNAKYSKTMRQRSIYGDKDEIVEFYRNCPSGYEVDHIIPLNGKSVSGLHVRDNLQYLTKEENRKKYNKWG